ncbi:MAG: hypothetical protein U5K32_03015 [Bacteroidales bacterium]|nr:hypothetical protein [Bacteroidales bacterium]
MLKIYFTIAGLIILLSATAQKEPETIATGEQLHTPPYGCFIHPSLSNLAGKSTNEEPNSLSIHLLSAYKFRNGLSVGAGSGAEHLEMPLLPVYGYLRYDLNDSRATPYAWLKAGYGFSLEADEAEGTWSGSYRESNGGILLNAGMGIVLFSRKNMGVNMGVGYRFQKVSTTYHDTWWGSNEESVRTVFTEFNRFELQLGIVFR